MSVCTSYGMPFVIYRDVVMDNKHKKIIVMKKFLTISMMALALVFATSCEKDNEESLDNYVNTWVTDEIPLTEIAGDDITAEFPELPEGIQAVLAQQLANVKLRAVINLAADGKAQAGVLVNKTKLNLMVTAMETLFSQYESQLKPEELAQVKAVMEVLKPFVAGLKDNDYVGVPFTYTVAPTDATSGKITLTLKDEEGKDTVSEIDYRDLSSDSITIESVDENDSSKKTTMTLKSASSAKVTVGDFVDIAQALNSLMPKE